MRIGVLVRYASALGGLLKPSAGHVQTGNTAFRGLSTEALERVPLGFRTLP